MSFQVNTTSSAFNGWPSLQRSPKDARSLDLFYFSHPVGDNPMATHELHRVTAFVGNVDGVEKKPLTPLRAGAARIILRLDAYSDVSSCGFGGEHLFDRLYDISGLGRPAMPGGGTRIARPTIYNLVPQLK